MWLVTMLLPLVGNLQGFYIPLLNMIYVLDDTSWHMAAIASLAANVLMFTLISLFTNASPEETSAAEACAVDNVRRPQRRELHAASPCEFATQLAKPLGAKAAQRKWSRHCAICTCPSMSAALMPCAACATASRPTCRG